MDPSPELADLATRLSRLLRDLPDHPAVIDTCDYVAGALYSLMKCKQLPYWNRKSDFLSTYRKNLAKYISNMAGGQDPGPYWMSGYLLNSAMQRVAAAYDRVPKLILGISKHGGNPHGLMEKVCKDASKYSNWKDVYLEVNAFKHEVFGRARGRQVGRNEAVDALREVVSLLEAKRDEIAGKWSEQNVRGDR